MPIPNRAAALGKVLAGISLERFMELNVFWSMKYKELRKLEHREKRASLNKGMVVKFSYAKKGVTRTVHAVVDKVLKTRASVHEIDDAGRRMPGKIWRVSLTMLEKSERSELR